MDAVVNGVRIYYEEHGPKDERPPLVLLHGGVGGIEMFGPNLPALARRHHVIALDLEGHGRSDDADRPLRFETMADNVAALMGKLGVRQADVIGYSLGGAVALQTTFRHPDLVQKLIVISSPCRREGFYPEILAIFDQMSGSFGASMKQSPLAKMYPDRDWERLFTKLGDLQRQPFDWSRDVAKMRAQTLLIFADADTYRPEHIVEFYKILGGGQRDAGMDGSLRSKNQLAIIPNTTHYNLLATPAAAALIEAFVDAS